MLSTIASAMLTFTGLVFTVTMLVLQLASAQLSPPVMRTFLRDRVNQGVLGLFIATFLYALLVLRDVRSPANAAAFVPSIAVTVAYLLVLASVGLFVVYIHHMAQAIRAATVLRSVADETRKAIRRLYPEGVGDEPSPPLPSLPERPADAVAVLDRSPGVFTSVDERALVHLAVVGIMHRVQRRTNVMRRIEAVGSPQPESRSSSCARLVGDKGSDRGSAGPFRPGERPDSCSESRLSLCGTAYRMLVESSHTSQSGSETTPWDTWDAWDSSHKGSDVRTAASGCWAASRALNFKTGPNRMMLTAA